VCWFKHGETLKFESLLFLLFPLLTPIPIRYITRLLEDVVFFMIHKENPGAQRPDPLVEEGVVDRDRQKLVREQDVLREVGGACYSCEIL